MSDATTARQIAALIATNLIPRVPAKADRPGLVIDECGPPQTQSDPPAYGKAESVPERQATVPAIFSRQHKEGLAQHPPLCANSIAFGTLEVRDTEHLVLVSGIQAPCAKA